LPTQVNITPSSFLEKCCIHWKTRNYGRKIEHIALMLSVAVFMNKKVYEEELKSAYDHLTKLMDNESDANNVMDYVKMRLGSYQHNNEAWMKDRQEAFNLIMQDEDLYGYMIDIFNSDDCFDENEEIFEKALKRLL